ncbi:hypothetical protein F5Y16DRAFT_405746 [Xylariaceae sp. FL0255]|nr:hypothetical protein F5Y16DRAFT_405746 [Xylariaceae sp. FL0255]
MANVTIGCGVNFATNTAFYTRDGSILGRAFTEIRGKLYPAVSMNRASVGWRITAKFPEEDGKSDAFVFKGDFKSEETLVAPQPMKYNSDSEEQDLDEASNDL